MKIKYRLNNPKLGHDTAVLNITSATDCPSKKRGLCAHPQRCYAMKAERQYTCPERNCLTSRRAQAVAWSRTSAADIVAQLLGISKRRRSKGAIKYLRFSEAGDFRNQQDVNKMIQIAALLRPHRIKVYGYTARRDLNFKACNDNITVNGSGFIVHNEFKAVPRYTGMNRMCLMSCKICNKCKVSMGWTIEVKYH